MRGRAFLAVVMSIMAVLTVPGLATAASRPDACGLISSGKLGSILGLAHVLQVRNIVGQPSPRDRAGVVHSVCTGVAWSGSPPMGKTAELHAVRAGAGAAFAIETWEPDELSPNVDTWNNKDFDELVGRGIIASLTLPPPIFGAKGGPKHPQRFTPSKFGGSGAHGETFLPMTGIRATTAFWWRDSTHTLVEISIGEAASKPGIKHLKAIAGSTVPAFGV